MDKPDTVTVNIPKSVLIHDVVELLDGEENDELLSDINDIQRGLVSVRCVLKDKGLQGELTKLIALFGHLAVAMQESTNGTGQ